MAESRKVTVFHDTPAVRKVMDEVKAEVVRLGDFEALRRGLAFLDREKYPELRARIDRVLEDADRQLAQMTLRVQPGDWVEIGGRPFRIGREGRKGFVYTERIDASGGLISSVPTWADGLEPLSPERLEEIRRLELASDEAPSLERSARGNLDLHCRLLGDRHLD